MGFLQSLVLSALALGATCNQLQIPEVEQVVASILQKYSNHVNFKSNVTDVPASQPVPGVHTDSAAASSYWYENIAHQGISAFGPSGYTVYRNVKDYGAKGSCFPHSCNLIYVDCICSKATVLQTILQPSTPRFPPVVVAAKAARPPPPLPQSSTSQPEPTSFPPLS